MVLSVQNKMRRGLWNVVWLILFRPFSTKLFNPWRLFLLRLFGARIHKKSGVYASCKIWDPGNLELKKNAWLGPYVICYNVAKIKLSENATVSQYSHLCSASHNVFNKNHSLIADSIVIEKQAWVGADAFIGMGVTVGQGAVVGAKSAVFKDVEPWTIVGGNPAKFIKKRVIDD